MTRVEIGEWFVLRNAEGDVIVDSATGLGMPASWEEVAALLPEPLAQSLSGEFVPLDPTGLMAGIRALAKTNLPSLWAEED